jgi:ankyrin repeat protein
MKNLLEEHELISVFDLITMLEGITGNKLTEKAAGFYKTFFDKTFSDEILFDKDMDDEAKKEAENIKNAKLLLMFLLNFGSDGITEKQLEEELMDLPKKPGKAKLKPLIDFIQSLEELLEILAKENFIYIQQLNADKKHIKIKNDILYRALLFEDELNYMREDMVNPLWMLKELLMDKDGPNLKKISAVLKIIKEKGIDINAKTYIDTCTAFHVAARYCTDPKIIEELYNAGAKIDIYDGDNEQTALHYAAASNQNYDVIDKIIKLYKININMRTKNGSCPIHFAAEYNPNKDVMNKLIENGAFIAAENHVEKERLKPIQYAARFNPSHEVVEALLKALQNENRPLNDRTLNERTLLHLSVCREDPKKDIVKVLIDYCKGDIKIGDNAGYTPLHYAAGYTDGVPKSGIPFDHEILKLLINAGADVNAKAGCGYTPLHLASIFTSNEMIINTLIQNKASINARDHKGMTPLHHASEKNSNENIVIALIKNKAKVNETDGSGYTPLHYAAAYNTPEIVDR